MTASCSPANEDSQPAADTAVVPTTSASRGPELPDVTVGTLRMVGATLHLARCGAIGDGTALEDGTEGDAVAIVQELGPDGVTAVLTLTGNRLTSLIYAAPEGPTCENLPPESALEARGQEPFWFVSVSGNVATVRTPDELEGVEYRGGRWSVADGVSWRYEAARGGEPLVLELARERCADGMSGARYPFKATLTRNGVVMSGCALPGRGE